ncbi:hypothetical protein RA26_16840 [Leisingera sp. ANG-M7]|nr:hypothetical protein RA26_16840 [Leisingera sp. ANG-M7]
MPFAVAARHPAGGTGRRAARHEYFGKDETGGSAVSGLNGAVPQQKERRRGRGPAAPERPVR